MTTTTDLKWGIFDIQDVRQDLEDHEALILLDYIKANYQCKDGIPLETIRTVANDFYPESKL